MVSQDSPPNPDTTNILDQFITTQNQYDQSQHFDAYGFPNHHSNMTLFSFPGMSRTMSIDPNQTQNRNPTSVSEESAQISHTRRLMDLLGATANDHQQRLSLSLNSHNILVPPMQQHYHNYNDNDNNNNNNDNAFAASSSRHCAELYGAEAIGVSRYLKPTQSLLEEIVSLGSKELDSANDKYSKLFRGRRDRGALSLSAELRAEFSGNGEAQAKLAKLISLLEQVEKRYEKYYGQMEEVTAAFEVIAGHGTARSYTALALQAMSRHFSSLREAIVARINGERRRLAQELPKISAGLSQLSLFDGGDSKKTNRMTFQQLGLIQSHQRQAWRPIRGLPETSVVILRAWLFEHFLHPYPNDSEKLMLASQTGLSKNQVSNWFINARVRLWKPMIEEMYKEEFGDSSEDSNPLGVGGFVGEAGTDHEEN